MCKKVGFDLKTAKTVLNQCKGEHRKEQRYYLCPECSLYHLTKDEEYNEKVFLKEDELIFKDMWMKLKKG